MVGGNREQEEAEKEKTEGGDGKWQALPMRNGKGHGSTVSRAES